MEILMFFEMEECGGMEESWVHCLLIFFFNINFDELGQYQKNMMCGVKTT